MRKYLGYSGESKVAQAYADLIGGATTWDILERINVYYPAPNEETPEQQHEVVKTFIHNVCKDLLEVHSPVEKVVVLPVKQLTKEEIAELEFKMKVEGKL